MKKQDALFAVALLAVIACALALLLGCAVDQSWRPQVGDSYDVVRQKLDGGTKFITVEGSEVRWWLEHPRTAQRWLYYARFDGPPRRTYFLRYDAAGNPSLERVEDSPSKLVEWERNTRAYEEAEPR